MTSEYVGLFQRLDAWVVLRLNEEGESLGEFAAYVEHEAPEDDWLIMPVYTAVREHPAAMVEYRRYERAMRRALEEARP